MTMTIQFELKLKTLPEKFFRYFSNF